MCVGLIHVVRLNSLGLGARLNPQILAYRDREACQVASSRARVGRACPRAVAHASEAFFVCLPEATYAEAKDPDPEEPADRRKRAVPERDPPAGVGGGAVGGNVATECDAPFGGQFRTE
eukprot:3775676-Prymnesium_polylepis.1